jgi:hypothetical protein
MIQAYDRLLAAGSSNGGKKTGLVYNVEEQPPPPQKKIHLVPGFCHGGPLWRIKS